jgi:integrase
MPYRPKGARYWWASLPLPGGGRKRVSLETDDVKVARTREAEMRNALEREKLGLEVRDKNPRKLTLAKAVDNYLETPRAKKQAQHADLTYTLHKHVHRDPIGKLRLEQVTPGALVEWLDRREAGTEDEEGVSPTTCNRLRANISAVFRSLIEREIFKGENPTKKLRPRKEEDEGDEEGGKRSRLLPTTAILPLIDAAPTRQWRLAFALAAYTGMRLGEVRRLKWSHIDFDGRLVQLKKTKTGVPRTVPLHRALLAELKAAKERAHAHPHDPVISKAGFDKAAVVTRNALKRAGVEVSGGVQACFHSLRHTWSTRLIDCGADPFVVQLIGWGPPKGSVMATHYARPTKALLDAIDVLSWPEPPNPDGAEVIELHQNESRNGQKEVGK